MSSPSDIDNAMQLALREHGAGNLQRAEKIYRDILRRQPDHPDASHFLGVIALQVGRAKDAVALIRRAVQLAPSNADAHSNLGNALQAAGKTREAIDAYDRALSIEPNAIEARANLGNAFSVVGQWHEAIEQYRTVLSVRPELAEVHRNLAWALLKADEPEAALASANEAMRLAPGSIPAILTAGNVLQALSRFRDAERCFREVLARRPDSPEVLGNLASVLREQGDLAASIAECDKAIELRPGYPEGYYNRALARVDGGEMAEAEQDLRKTLELAPEHAKAWRKLVNLSAEISDVDIATMKAQYERPDAAEDDRVQLGFALGKCKEDRGQYAEAFSFYRSANGLRRSQIRFSIADERRLFDNLRHTFDKKLFDKYKDVGVTDAMPIFIIGMPRSGTSLVEQILASHRDVTGGGELMVLPRVTADTFPLQHGVDYTAALREAEPSRLRGMAEAYLAELRRIAQGASRVTDKLPMNFLNVGLIRLFFPNACVIHCLRNPVDTCLSIYKHYFTARGHHYAYDLEELGRYYNLYADLMAHWRSVLPGFIHHVTYEVLVANQEAQTRGLLHTCGLPWDDNCLRFYETERTVATISAAQVRRPMYDSSVEAWRQYEKELGPLLATLQTEVP